MSTFLVVAVIWIILGQIAYQICHWVEGGLGNVRDALFFRLFFAIVAPLGIILAIIVLFVSSKSPFRKWLESKPPRWL